jgi:biotin carboxyl carrier protein
MIKKLRVTVDGKAFEVTVEMADEPPATPSPRPASVTSAAISAPVLAAPTPTTSSASASPGDVPSPLAGRVTAINVQPGQQVKEGDHLLTLEAMKMNTLIQAPRDGKVKEVKVAVGAAVEEGQGLVSIE